MASSYLLSLPFELRYEIYSLVFASPTGFVVLSDMHDSLVSWSWRRTARRLSIHPYSPPLEEAFTTSPMNMSLLLVCKQTYADIQGGALFWGLNALFLPRAEDLHYFVLLDTFAYKLRTQMSHVQLKIDVFNGTPTRDFDDMATTLEMLVTWSHYPDSSLRTLDLSLSRYITSMQFFDQPSHSGGMKSTLSMYSNVLKAVAGEVGLGKRVKKRLIVDIPPKRFDEWTRRWRDEEGIPDFTPAEERARKELLVESRPLVGLHKVFGGELWVEGRLCYSDGVRIREGKLTQRTQGTGFF